jgi:DNA-binding PadR family transcriptional regulator
MKHSRSRDPSSYLPLKPDTFRILTILAQDDHYGYGIMQASARMGGGTPMQAGALYRRLKWMLNEGLIQEQGHRITDGERRKYYRLTEFGRSVAEAEAGRMNRCLDAAREASLFRDAEPVRES